jgi:hypothetical protein
MGYGREEKGVGEGREGEREERGRGRGGAGEGKGGGEGVIRPPITKSWIRHCVKYKYLFVQLFSINQFK